MKIQIFLYRMYHTGRRYLVSIMVIFSMLIVSCKKFVAIETPPGAITQENVFSNDRTAVTILNGLYTNAAYSNHKLSMYPGLLADEFDLWSGADQSYMDYYTNDMVVNPAFDFTAGGHVWEQYYQQIFTSNAAIEGLEKSTTLTPVVQKQLRGEAYFMRAFYFFYLTSLYGDVPLALSTDPNINRKLPRAPKNDVYLRMINDLKQAQSLLSSSFVNLQLNPYTSNPERVRPTQWAATSLLARVYLFAGDNANAAIEASKVIEHTALFSLDPLTSIFLKNSQEAIFQVQPGEVGFNTYDGLTFHLGADPIGLSYSKPVHLSSSLLAAFEPNDLRRVNWVDSIIQGGTTYYYPTKYTKGNTDPSITSAVDLTEYSMMLRLSEQYLIRAEAKARTGDLSGAVTDLDAIRQRAGLPLIATTNPTISQPVLIDLILHERQVELFSEWGHRWFDLKRTGKINAVMSVITPMKGGNWETTDQLLPIPFNDIKYNPNLTQNPGY